jgi:hypothetical protein
MNSATEQLLIGVGFTAICIGVIVWILRQRQTFQPLHYMAFVVIASGFAGFAGAFFTGAALLKFHEGINQNNELSFEATAGFALFALVLLTMRPFIPKPNTRPVGGPGAEVSIGLKTPFIQAAQEIARQANASIEFEGFKDTELNAIPKSANLQCGNPIQATASLKELHRLVQGKVRPFKVELDQKNNHFTLVIA